MTKYGDEGRVPEIMMLKADCEQSLAARDREIATLKAAIATPEVYAGVVTRVVEEERDKVERAKAKLMSIKTNKEYYAMLKEIEGTRRTNVAREEELLSLLVRYEDAEKRLSERKADLDEVSGKYRERMVDIDARMGTFDDDIGKLDARRRHVAGKLDPSLVRRFEMIFERRDGLAVVAARNYSCTGCHMNIAPQLFNLLQREDRIHTCPNCNRVVYYEATEIEVAGE